MEHRDIQPAFEVGDEAVEPWTKAVRGTYARTKAEAWWLRRAAAPVPSTVQEAIDRKDELEPSAAIQLTKDGQYMRVARHQLAREQEQVAA